MRTRLPLLAALADGAFLYAPVLAAMGRQWLEDTTTAHGILLAAAAAVVVYRKLPLLRRQSIQPDAAGVWVVVFGLAVYLLGTLGINRHELEYDVNLPGEQVRNTCIRCFTNKFHCVGIIK